MHFQAATRPPEAAPDARQQYKATGGPGLGRLENPNFRENFENFDFSQNAVEPSETTRKPRFRAKWLSAHLEIALGNHFEVDPCSNAGRPIRAQALSQILFGSREKF